MRLRRRRTVTALAVLLGCGTLPVLAAAPAHATPGCVRDVPVVLLLTPDGCDDTTPPETAIGTTVPRMVTPGWINKRTLRVELIGTHTDADTDPISFECSLSHDPAPPSEPAWTPCPEGGVFRNLAETSAPYVLWVRAVDDTDAAVTWFDANPLNGLVDDEPARDHDPTPARLDFRVDTTAPDTTIAGLPADRLRPELPMVRSDRPTLRLGTSEPGRLQCTLDGTPVPCSPGTTTFGPLAPGVRELRAYAVDRAGNVDPTAAVARFAVPTDLPRGGRGWTRVRDRRALGGSYLVARERGSTLSVPARGAREVRLLAATGPSAGVVAVRLGSRWRRVDLRRARPTARDQVPLLDGRGPRLRGRILVRVVSAGRPVHLDGLLVH